MPKQLENEIKFLTDFGKRFQNKETYLAAIGDLLRQGLITKKAHDTVVARKNKPITPGLMVKKALNIAATQKERKRRQPVQPSGGCGSARNRYNGCTPVPIRGSCDSGNSRC